MTATNGDTAQNNRAEVSDAEQAFQRWWRASKYCQVVVPREGWEQIARDGFFAALSTSHPEPTSAVQVTEAMVGRAMDAYLELGRGCLTHREARPALTAALSQSQPAPQPDAKENDNG